MISNKSDSVSYYGYTEYTNRQLQTNIFAGELSSETIPKSLPKCLNQPIGPDRSPKMCGRTVTAFDFVENCMDPDTSELDKLAGEVQELANLISYQDGAIVSRTLVDSESATLTLFAIDENQRISEHSAPHDALLQVLDGTANITIEAVEYEVSAGESIVFPANIPHAVEGQSNFKMLLTMIR